MKRSMKIVLLAVVIVLAAGGFAVVRGKRAEQKPAAAVAVAEFLQNDLYIVEPGALERSLPITGSIMPPFTLALYGADSVARLTRGFVVGLTGFTTFFLVVALAAIPWGITAAFVAAVLGALAAVTVASRTLRIAHAR